MRVMITGILFALICFAIQFVLCRRASSLPLRLIPAFLVLLGTFFSLLLYLGVFGTFSAGMLGNGHQLLALICLLVLGVAALSVGAAWIISHFLPKRDH